MKRILFSLLIYCGLVSFAYGAEPFSHLVTMKTSSGGTNYVDATLAGSITATFLVDTGSGMLVVNRKTFKTLKKSNSITYSHEAAARLANGKIQKVDVYTVPQFRIGEYCEIGAD